MRSQQPVQVLKDMGQGEYFKKALAAMRLRKVEESQKVPAKRYHRRFSCVFKTLLNSE